MPVRHPLGVGWIKGARSVDPPLEGSVVTLGTFDGVHRGHQALIRETVDRARLAGVPAIAYTFDPHPAKVLAPRFAPRTLMALDRRVATMVRLGVDDVVVEVFDAAFSQVRAEAWVREDLFGRLRPRAVVVGFNFTFGKDREGTPDRLAELGRELGFEVVEVPAVHIGGLSVSSTKVREFVTNGNVEGAAELLGRPFAMTGTVVRGEQRGRQLGFPTANINADAEIIPAHGVYASRVGVVDGDGPRWFGVTNVGMRPTFAGDHVTVETHLLDVTADLYGRRLQVDFVARIRGEKRFVGPEALSAQVAEDVATARAKLSS